VEPEYGGQYVVDGALETPDSRKANVKRVGVVEHGEEVPHEDGSPSQRCKDADTIRFVRQYESGHGDDTTERDRGTGRQPRRSD